MVGDAAPAEHPDVTGPGEFERVVGEWRHHKQAIDAPTHRAHGLALLSLPADSGFFDRWVDVMVSVCVVAAVVHVLANRNDELFARLAGEARTDKLTGLLNRRGFEERAAIELAHAKREGDSIALEAANAAYETRIFGPDRIRVQGRLVGLLRKY